MVGRSPSGPMSRRPPTGLRAWSAQRRRPVRGLRPARPLDRPLPRRAERVDPARRQVAGRRRRPLRPAPRARVPGPGQGRRPIRPAGPADGDRRLRRRGVRDRRAPRRPRRARASTTRAMGPWSAGTAAVFLNDSAGNDGGAAGQTVYARGGPGALSAALAAAVRAAGGEIRTDAEVSGDHDARRSGDRRPAGLGRGDRGTDRRRRRRPEAGPDRRSLDPVDVGPGMRWRAANIRTPGTVATISLALTRPAPVRRGRRRRRRRAPAARAGSSSRRASTTSSGRSTPPSTAS